MISYPHVLYQKVSLLFLILRCPSWVVGMEGTSQWDRHNFRGATWVYEGVVVHVCGKEVLPVLVHDPVAYLIVKRRDKAALLAL